MVSVVYKEAILKSNFFADVGCVSFLWLFFFFFCLFQWCTSFEPCSAAFLFLFLPIGSPFAFSYVLVMVMFISSCCESCCLVSGIYFRVCLYPLCFQALLYGFATAHSVWSYAEFFERRIFMLFGGFYS